MWQYIGMHCFISVSVSLYKPRKNGRMVLQRTRASPVLQTGQSSCAVFPFVNTRLFSLLGPAKLTGIKPTYRHGNAFK